MRVVPQVGAFVARLDLARVRDALFVREAVECAALLRIPATLSAEQLASLKPIAQEHRAAVQRGDLPAILAAAEIFHQRLLDLANLSGARRHVLETREIHRRVRALAQPEFDAGIFTVRQHATIVRELAAGRTARAASATRGHIRMNAEYAERIRHNHPDFFVSARSMRDAGPRTHVG